MSNVTPLPERAPAPTLHQRVAANVRAEMARIGVTQAQLANVLHITQQSVSAKRSGKTAFTLNELDAIAPLLDMTVEELISGTRNPRQGGPGGGISTAVSSDARPEGLEPPTFCSVVPEDEPEDDDVLAPVVPIAELRERRQVTA